MIRTVLAAIYLAVSVASTLVQIRSLWKLAQWGDSHDLTRALIHKGLIRTSVCRVLAAVAYVVFGVSALTSSSVMTVAIVSLILFTAVQLMWQTNGILDVRLRSKIEDWPNTSGTYPR